MWRGLWDWLRGRASLGHVVGNGSRHDPGQHPRGTRRMGQVAEPGDQECRCGAAFLVRAFHPPRTLRGTGGTRIGSPCRSTTDIRSAKLPIHGRKPRPPYSPTRYRRWVAYGDSITRVRSNV